MIAMLIVSLLATDNPDQAVRAEQAAFIAVDEKRWCDAMALFVEANAHAPTADLIYNAARAAELANDRRLAVLLYTEVLGTNAKDRRRIEAKRKLKTIASLVEADGPGTPCTSPSNASSPTPEPTLDGIIVAMTESATPRTPAQAEAGQLVSLTSTAPVALEPPGTMVARVDDVWRPPLPWSTMAFGAGGVLLVGGAVTAAVGAAPWVGYMNAQQELRELEDRRSRDVDDAYRRQLEAEAHWNEFGRNTMSAGAALMTAGVLLLATGGVLRGVEAEQ